MIVGLGIDICDIKRIENTLGKYGDKFKRRCFTKKEIIKCNKVNITTQRFYSFIT